MSNSQLKSIVERIEKLEEEKSAIAEDIKGVYAESKGNGFEPKIIKQIVAMRRKDATKRREEQEMLAIYMTELGMLADTPLGRAAVARDLPAAVDDEDGF